ncbi:MAG: chromosomal replication initiator protein DnaA [Candidatus Brocadiales bacterium]|nr:chromosomal replication initiator protein DnaA [Candidatus Bathyanammoxibius amoris]
MTKEMREVWPKVLEELKGRLTPQQFQTWFAHIKPVAREGDNSMIELRVPSQYHKEWLSQSYRGLIEEVLSSVSGGLGDVKFTIESDLSTPPSVESSSYLNREYLFENFVVGPSNRLAHAAAAAVAESPGKAYNPLFLQGGVGLGKTHLLHAICLSLIEKNPSSRILYLPCESFVNHFIATVKTERWESFRNTYRGLDVLVIDDVHFISRSPRSREEFFHTFNALYNSQKQIILSSDCSPEDISEIEERLVSRFKWGLLARIEPPDFETRTAIIEKKASLSNLCVPPEAARILAEGVTDNVRELEGAIIRFSRCAAIDPSASPEAIAHQISSEFSKKGLSPVNIEKIMASVATSFDISLQQLQSRSRKRSTALARQVAMFLARRHTQLSLQEIGGYIGGRDHSTVIHAEEKVKTMKSVDKDFSQLLDGIEKDLHTGAS